MTLLRARCGGGGHCSGKNGATVKEGMEELVVWGLSSHKGCAKVAGV